MFRNNRIHVKQYVIVTKRQHKQNKLRVYLIYLRLRVAANYVSQYRSWIPLSVDQRSSHLISAKFFAIFRFIHIERRIQFKTHDVLSIYLQFPVHCESFLLWYPEQLCVCRMWDVPVRIWVFMHVTHRQKEINYAKYNSIEWQTKQTFTILSTKALALSVSSSRLTFFRCPFICWCSRESSLLSPDDFEIRMGVRVVRSFHRRMRSNAYSCCEHSSLNIFHSKWI